MRAVLGIDAAWTSKQPSGVALAAKQTSGWQLVAVSASYQRFHALADVTLAPEMRPSGSLPIAAALLASAALLGGKPVDLVAIDMPLSRTPIVARRTADNAVSRAYGARKCGTHTPSAIRPGRISDELRAQFEHAGYPLQTLTLASPGVIEVYPHPALVELAGARERLPYKAGKRRDYWPVLGPDERLERLALQWREIVALLECEISGVSSALPPLPVGTRGAPLKTYEDMLDAVICAWVAIGALEGRALPFGDQDAAIWIPAPLAPAEPL